MVNWNSENGGDFSSKSGDSNGFSTRKIISLHCQTEEIEPGKFVRKCEKTEQIFRDCVGRPSEEVQSIKEYTEEDVTDQVVKGSSLENRPSQPFDLKSSQPFDLKSSQPFDFPGLRSDIEAIERSFFGGINRFFEAAEDIKNEFFNDVFSNPQLYEKDSSSSNRFREVPVQRPDTREDSPKQEGHVDLSGLAREV